MKSQPSHRELLIIRLICYSFIAWSISYVYMNSWTGLNINKVEQARIARIETKAALKKSLSVLLEAGFSDEEVINKQIELLAYFFGENEIEEGKDILTSLEKTLASSTSLSFSQRTRAYSMCIMAYQFLNDFDKANQVAQTNLDELKKALSSKLIEKEEFEKLSGIIENNSALTQYLQAGCEENINARRKLFVGCIKKFKQATKMLAKEKSLSAIADSNSTSAGSEIVFDTY